MKQHFYIAKYDDIINLPHHVSGKHPPMSMTDRAAQFSPFAALTGYDEAVAETARVTGQKHELSDEEAATLDWCKNRHPSPICTQFEHHFHALKPHLLYHSF